MARSTARELSKDGRLVHCPNAGISGGPWLTFQVAVDLAMSSGWELALHFPTTMPRWVVFNSVSDSMTGNMTGF